MPAPVAVSPLCCGCRSSPVSVCLSPPVGLTACRREAPPTNDARRYSACRGFSKLIDYHNIDNIERRQTA